MAPERKRLLFLLRAMPDEAFGWVLNALAHNIFPDGLGGFALLSRGSIVAVIAEAKRLGGYDQGEQVAPPPRRAPKVRR